MLQAALHSAIPQPRRTADHAKAPPNPSFIGYFPFLRLDS